MRFLYIAAILLSFGLGFPLLTRYPFRQDEAIYSVWALHFWQDPFFLTVWPDKPPIYLSALALAYRAFGVSEASARWLNISFTTLTVALVIASARHLWGQRAALLAGLTLALNPFVISFAPTAYTDPLLVLMGSAALYAALKRRSYWSGLWLGLAIMTKQQGLFYAPLLLGVLLICMSREHMGWAGWWRKLRWLAYCSGGAASIMAPILYWDSLRWATAPSPWDLSIRNYGGVALLPVAQWLDRGSDWVALTWYLLASNYLWGFVALLFFYLVVGRVSLPAVSGRRMKVASWPTIRRFGKPPYKSVVSFVERVSLPAISGQRMRAKSAPTLGLLLIAWLLGFMIIHMITNIQTWDRYLLPLVPVGALLWGGYLADVLAKFSPKLTSVVIAIWLLFLAPPAWSAANGDLPIGADHGDYVGLQQAVHWLDQEALQGAQPPKLVLYHNVLGWHFQFYLYEQIAHGQVELRWFPSALYLAQNATTAPHMRKFLITPSWAPVRELDRFATMLRVQIVPRARFGEMRIVELTPLPAGNCEWCYCNGWPDEIFKPIRKRHQ